MEGNINLTKVYIGAKSKESYNAATEYTFNAKLLVEICKDKVTVTKNKPFVIGKSEGSDAISTDIKLLSEMVILDCEPVHCGLLTVKTQFVVVDISEAKGKAIKNEETKVQPLCLSDFTMPLTIDQVGHHISTQKRSDHPCHVNQFFKVHALTQWKHFNPKSRFDENYVIYVPKVLAMKHKLFDDCLVECMSVNTFNGLNTQLSKTGNMNGCIQNGTESRHKVKKRNPALARIHVIPDIDLEADCVYLTATLLFNALKAKETSPDADVVLRVRLIVIICIHFSFSYFLSLNIL